MSNILAVIEYTKGYVDWVHTRKLFMLSELNEMLGPYDNKVKAKKLLSSLQRHRNKIVIDGFGSSQWILQLRDEAVKRQCPAYFFMPRSNWQVISPDGILTMHGVTIEL